jgi:hypothetical protein
MSKIDNDQQANVLSFLSNSSYKSWLHELSDILTWPHVKNFEDGIGLTVLNLDQKSVKYSTFKKLSKYGRIKLPISIDILESIEIPCFNSCDIKYVKLYMSIYIPRSLDIKEKVKNNIKLTAEEYNWMSDSDQYEKTYHCIKTITHFPENIVKFFDVPLPVGNININFGELSIEVKYKDGFRILDNLNYLKFNCVALSSSAFKKLRELF